MPDRIPKFLGNFAWLRTCWDFVKDVAAVLKPCRFSLIMLLLGIIFLVAAPQGRDVLRVMVEGTIDGGILGQWIWFFGAMLLWGVNAWYWARVMLRCRFDEAGRFANLDVKGTEHFQKLCRYVPRGLGTLGFMTVALAFVLAAVDSTGLTRVKLIGFAVLSALCGVGFLIFVFYRGRIILAAAERMKKGRFKQTATQVHSHASQVFSKASYGQVQSWKSFVPGTKSALVFFVGLSFIFFLIFTIDAQIAEHLGSGAIVLLAAGTWIPLGSMLVYVGSRYKVPVFGILLVLALVFSFINDNHKLRSLPGEPAPAVGVAADFSAWLQQRSATWEKDRQYPVYLVAAEGGGIRAAYWTGLVLASLQDIDPNFGQYLYAISGVSGGSLGAAVFDALLKEQKYQRDNGKELSCASLGSAGAAGEQQRMRQCLQAVLGRDFLSPTAAALLYPDVTQRFLPYPFSRLDRARALEMAWETSWTREFGNNRFAESFHDLWREPNADLPALFLNGTWVQTGKRIITSNLAVDAVFEDSVEFFGVHRQAIPLSTAVHNSARFTYVSPAGLIEQGGKRWGRIVDGGYFENSGATTAAEIFEVMMDKVASAGLSGQVLPVFIMITNDPDQCSEHDSSTQQCPKPKPASFLTELIAPLASILKTRTARGSYSRSEMERRVSANGGLFIEFGLQEADGPLPLGWVMSDTAHALMQNTLDRKLRPLCGELSPRRLSQLDTPRAPECENTGD